MSNSNNKIKINNFDRTEVMKYFYGTNMPIIIATVGIVASFILSILIKEEILFRKGIILSLIASGIMWFYENYISNSTAEAIYDQFLSEDLKCIEKIALRKLGLVSEQVSMIAPISVTGPGHYNAVIDEGPITTRFVKNIMKLISSMLLLVFKIIYKVISFIFKVIRILCGHKKEYVPVLKYKNGTDDKLRYSLVQAHLFFFSENQVYVYEANYDICSGEVFSEVTSEYFYRDIDCVITGEKIEKVFTGNKVIDKRYEFFKVVVTSGTSTYALADCPVSILETQVMGMRELIRNKKLEMV